jgi:hypothetical protein
MKHGLICMDILPPNIIGTVVLLIHKVPGISPCDFYLWDNLKDTVYRTNPYMEEELKENVQSEILEFPQEELLWMNLNLFKQYRECLLVQGQHFQHLLENWLVDFIVFMERYVTRIRKIL